MGSVLLSTFPQLSPLKGEITNLTYTLLIYNKFRNKLSKIIDTFRLGIIERKFRRAAGSPGWALAGLNNRLSKGRITRLASRE